MKPRIRRALLGFVFRTIVVAAVAGGVAAYAASRPGSAHPAPRAAR